MEREVGRDRGGDSRALEEPRKLHEEQQYHIGKASFTHVYSMYVCENAIYLIVLEKLKPEQLVKHCGNSHVGMVFPHILFSISFINIGQYDFKCLTFLCDI